MSYEGRQVVAYIDRALLEVEWWKRYSDRLTPPERHRVSHGDYRAFWRPLVPTFGDGDWLQVGPKLAVQLDSVELRHGRWRCRIQRVRDDRAPTWEGPPMQPTYDDPELMTNTLAIFGNPRPPEPERMDADDTAHSAQARERYEREQGRRRQLHAELPIETRLASLRRKAAESHVDISAEVRVIERRVASIERKILNRAA